MTDPQSNLNLKEYTNAFAYMKLVIASHLPDLEEAFDQIEQIRAFAHGGTSLTGDIHINEEREVIGQLIEGTLVPAEAVIRIDQLPFAPVALFQNLRLDQLSFALSHDPSLAANIADILIKPDKPWGKDYRPEALLIEELARQHGHITNIPTPAYAIKLLQAANQQPRIKTRLAAIQLLTRACETDPTISPYILPYAAEEHEHLSQAMRAFLKNDERNLRTAHKIERQARNEKALNEACRAALWGPFSPYRDSIDRIIAHKAGDNPYAGYDLPVAEDIAKEARAHLPHLIKHAQRLLNLAKNALRHEALRLPAPAKPDSQSAILVAAYAADDVSPLFAASLGLLHTIEKQNRRQATRPGAGVYRFFSIPGLHPAK